MGAILFSTKAIIVKVAFAHTATDALTLLTLRMVFSLPFYIGTAWVSSRNKNNVSLTQRQWLYIFILGLFGYYLSSLFDFIGLQYVSAGLERLILFLYPTFAVLINAAVFKQQVTRIQRIALVLTYIGIGIAYVGELHIDTGNPNFLWGSFLIFLCAITYSSYIAGSGYMVPRVGAARFTSYSMLAATTGIFLHFLIAGNHHALVQQANVWWYGILLAIVATVIPTFMLSEGMKRIGTNNVAIISAVGPVSTILQAHFVLHENIFMAQIAGTILVIIGILLIGWKK